MMKKEYELANEKYVYVSSHVVTDDMGKKGKYKLPCMDMLYFNEFRKKCKNKSHTTKYHYSTPPINELISPNNKTLSILFSSI